MPVPPSVSAVFAGALRMKVPAVASKTIASTVVFCERETEA